VPALGNVTGIEMG